MSDESTMHVSATEEIAAPPEEVFEALTDPEALEQWFLAPGAATTHDWELDLAPGGEWRARTVAPDGSEGVMHGEFVTIDAPHTLELTWHTSWEEFVPTTVRYDLEPIWVDGERATRLTVTHVGGVVAGVWVGAAAQGSWQNSLLRLGEYLIAMYAITR